MSFLNLFRPAEEQKSLEEDVLEHISDLLNTRKGFGSQSPSVGMDLSEFSRRDSLAKSDIASEIRRNIEEFEPRITVLSVTPDGLEVGSTLSFTILCKFNNRDRLLSLFYERGVHMPEWRVEHG